LTQRDAGSLRRRRRATKPLAGRETDPIGEICEAALDHLARGVIVVSRSRRVILLNRAAADIAALADGLTIADGTVFAATCAETAALSRLIAGARPAGNLGDLDPSGAIALARPSQKRALSVLVAPLPATAMARNRLRPAAILFVSDPERDEETSWQVLARLYNLTPAEARLAAALVQGRGLDCAAKCLGIGLNTAHSEARSLFAKTRVHRQAELVRLVLRGPGGLRFD
jgi:DNA-binding CsgD family transcriptional regulator